jgi:murein DD-endopeptidase MepM/ murein hydrolase activator NlpD
MRGLVTRHDDDMIVSAARTSPRQELVRATRHLAQGVLELGLPETLSRGMVRGVATLRGWLRLQRWLTRRRLRQVGKVAATLGVRRLVPLAGALLATVACQLISTDGGAGDSPSVAKSTEGAASLSLGARPPSLAKSVAATIKKGPWAYVLPVDHGVRVDESGKGSFRAPRFHGEHNGIDLLAPIGTAAFAACAGKATSGTSKSFGRWVHLVCPVPEELAHTGEAHASFFYAHLAESELPEGRWVRVLKAQTVGTIGKTGNAQGEGVEPHLHLELIIQKSQKAAMDERHLGADQSMVAEAREFLQNIDERCLEPTGFQPKSGTLRRARRVDPFVALTCLSPDKPAFAPAPKPLERASSAWSEYYLARAFDVDRGPHGLLVQ